MTAKEFGLWLKGQRQFRTGVRPVFLWVFLCGAVLYLLPLAADTAMADMLIRAVVPYLPAALQKQYWALHFPYLRSSAALVLDVFILPVSTLVMIATAAPALGKVLQHPSADAPSRSEFGSFAFLLLGSGCIFGLFLFLGAAIAQGSFWLLIWPMRLILVFFSVMGFSLGAAMAVALLATARPRPKRHPLVRTKWKMLHPVGSGPRVTGLLRLGQQVPDNAVFELSDFNARKIPALQLWLVRDLDKTAGRGAAVPADRFLGYLDSDLRRQTVLAPPGTRAENFRFAIIRPEGVAAPLAYAGL